MLFPRFRVRTLMIAVAVLGMLFGAGLLSYRRRAEFQKLAANHDLAAAFAGKRTACIVESQGFWMTVDLPDEDTELVRLRDKWHTILAKKYAWAARYPFLPVTSDPPEPTTAPEPLPPEVETPSPPPSIRRGDGEHDAKKGSSPLDQIPIPEEFVPGRRYR